MGHAAIRGGAGAEVQGGITPPPTVPGCASPRSSHLRVGDVDSVRTLLTGRAR